MQKWKKDIVLFLTSQTISLFGTSLVQYAILWYITLNTQSGIMMTLYIICGFIPTFFLSPFAGVWADRYDRKKLIVLSDSLIALATLVLAILFLLGYDYVWLLLFMAAIRALGSGVQTPAVGAILPQIVPEEKLTKVNGINSSIQSMVNLLSPMASGALLSFTTIEKIFFIDVATAAIGVSIFLFFIKVPVHAKAKEKQTISYFADMRQGFLYIKNHSFIKQFFVFATFFFILMAPASFLTPLQVTRSFGEDVWRLTAIEVAFSLGMMLGGILIAMWGGFRNRTHTLAMSIIVFGAGTFALGVVPFFSIYLLIMGLIGIIVPMFNTPSMVLLQEKVEEDYRGRVFGVLSMIMSSTLPLSMLGFGPLADVMRIETLLIITGILLFVQGLLLLGNKVLIEAGEPKSLD